MDTSEADAGVPNLPEEASWFEWAGVGLPRGELPRLFGAMTALKAQSGLQSVRFFGKVLGTKSDYYVVEGTRAGGSEGGTAAEAAAAGATPAEAPGTGLNTHVYFVARDPSAAFVRLPDVLPAQVVAAMQIKKYLTGELEAPVKSYPAFPGSERHYLRAQIARIAAATVLVPAGKLAVDDEAEGEPKPLVASEDFAAKSAAEMEEADNWVHRLGGVLRSGRATNPPVAEDEEAEDAEEEVAALAPVSGDAPVADPLPDSGTATPAWSLTRYCPQARDAAVVVAKSNRWPGAFSAVVGGKHANLYIGYGAEATAAPFTPAAPPLILREAAEVEEQPDVALEVENAVLKEIDELRIQAEAADEEPQEE